MFDKKKKNILKSVLLMVFISLIHVYVYAAWLDNIPILLTQPDETQIEAFRSGDEYHNWVHDDEYYTIIRDEATGYWCWAQATVDGFIVSTGFPIHTTSRSSLGLNPRENISEERYLEKRETWEVPAHLNINTRTPSTGIIQNLVIFIRFADDDEFDNLSTGFYDMFNAQGANVNSLYQYFWDVSYQNLEVISTFYPVIFSYPAILSYQSPNPRSYFKPFDSENPDGYPDSEERRNREHTLLKEAVEFIHDQVPQNLIIDSDDDGNVDNIIFVIKGVSDEWSDLLWPHKSSLWSFDVRIHGKRVMNYNFNIEYLNGFYNLHPLNVGILAHEFAHSLGLPDLYRYNSGLSPIGLWDIMSDPTNPPQSISAYMKWKYTDWISTLPIISESGQYELYSLTKLDTYNNPRAYRINSPYMDEEFFVIEYRDKTGSLIDTQIPGSGLLVYRVNTLSGNGNANSPDELYVYRYNGTPYFMASSSRAHYPSYYENDDYYKDAIHKGTNPEPFLSDGNQGGLHITDISIPSLTLSFYVTIIESSQEVFVKPGYGDDDNYPDYYDTIKEAVHVVGDQGTIYIYPGLYTGESNRNIIFPANKDISIIGLIIDDQSVIIDCAGGIAFSFRNKNSQNKISNLEIINAGRSITLHNSTPIIDNMVFRGSIPSNSRNHIIQAYNDSDILESVLITNSSFIGYTNLERAISANVPSLKIINCLFQDLSSPIGSSLNFTGRNIHLENNLFEGNIGNYGGAVINIVGIDESIDDSYIKIINNTFLNNSSLNTDVSINPSTNISISDADIFDDVFISGNLFIQTAGETTNSPSISILGDTSDEAVISYINNTELGFGNSGGKLCISM